MNSYVHMRSSGIYEIDLQYYNQKHSVFKGREESYGLIFLTPSELRSASYNSSSGVIQLGYSWREDMFIIAVKKDEQHFLLSEADVEDLWCLRLKALEYKDSILKSLAGNLDDITKINAMYEGIMQKSSYQLLLPDFHPRRNERLGCNLSYRGSVINDMV